MTLYGVSEFPLASCVVDYYYARMRGWVTACTWLLMIWVAAWVMFLREVPKAPNDTLTKTDAIIVLTGGAGRVEHGFSQLAKGLAPRLLISGVGTETTLEELLQTHSAAPIRHKLRSVKHLIALDHAARSTRMNAEETARFARAHQLRSIRLVTANYHMPRSIREMHASMPALVIIPDAAFPKGFTKYSWWHHGSARYLLLSEFHKTLAVSVREWMEYVHQKLA